MLHKDEFIRLFLYVWRRRREPYTVEEESKATLENLFHLNLCLKNMFIINIGVKEVRRRRGQSFSMLLCVFHCYWCLKLLLLYASAV